MTWDTSERKVLTEIPYYADDDRVEDQHGGGIDVGDLLDVRNNEGYWREAVVEAVDEMDSNSLVVRYLFEGEDCTVVVSMLDQERVQPFGTYCFVPYSNPATKPLLRGQLVDVVDYHPTRMTYVKGLVMGNRTRSADTVQVKLVLRGNQIVEEYPINMIKPYGTKTFPVDHPDNLARDHFLMRYGATTGVAYSSSSSSSSSSLSSLTPRKRQYVRDIGSTETDPRFARYKQALRNANMQLVEMEGDGNCLFRAVSHQIYGTQAHHELVRQSCMDYMESEAAYFQPFVVGDFQAYIQRKRQDGVWGDDIEIQAICEIYDRPAQVMAYDPKYGAKQLRTFHETDGHRTPMRLSFYGGGHYDSIIGPDFQANIIPRVAAGNLEEARIALSRARRSGQSEEELIASLSNVQVSEQELLDNAIMQSRQQYIGSNNHDLESVLQESLAQAELDEKQLVRGAMMESGMAYDEEKALKASDLSATEQAELEHAILLSKQQLNHNHPKQRQDAELEQALIASQQEQEFDSQAKAIEDMELEEAIKLSRQADTDVSKQLLPTDEDDELQKAIQQSLLYR